MLRATVLLCLVANAVLTQSVPTAQYNGPTDDNIVDYDSRGSINDTIRADLPSCAADYSSMSVDNRRIFQNTSPKPHAICVRSTDGYFVAAENTVRKSFFMYYECGWTKIKIDLPSTSPPGTGCAFVGGKLFYARNGQILQFSSKGIYEKEFATGYHFLRLTALKDSVIYSTVYTSNTVLGYDVATGDLKYRFETVSAYGRGLAFDPSSHLHISTASKVVEKFTYEGVKIGEKTYSEISSADGILVDGDFNVIIADRGNKQVLVFSETGRLFKRIYGFDLPLDVGMSRRCTSLIVADYGHGYVYLV